jgi:hypothetical protein
MATPFLTIDKIQVKVLKIDFDSQLNRPSKPIIGVSGSQTNYLGDGGRLLNLSVTVDAKNYPNLVKLYKKGSKVTVISKSSAKYNGLYHITIFTGTETRPGRFSVTMKLQEDFVFNIVRQNFTNYQVKAQAQNTDVEVGQIYDVSGS